MSMSPAQSAVGNKYQVEYIVSAVFVLGLDVKQDFNLVRFDRSLPGDLACFRCRTRKDVIPLLD